MKKLLLLLILTSFTSCGIAQVEQAPLKKTVAWVQEKDGETARLQPSSSSVSYLVPDGEFKLEKEYVFWLEITDCHDCRTREAVVEKYAITTAQAQRDQREAAKKVSHRKIIK